MNASVEMNLPAENESQGSVPHAFDVRGLHFRYGKQDQAASPWIIRNVNFHVESGQILGIVGPNGSGKTSLLKLFARIARPSKGSIELFGHSLWDLTPDKVARSVAFVPQESDLSFPFTVAETVLMGRFPHRHHSYWDMGFGWDRRDDRAIAQQAMETMDVWGLAGRAVTELSGGERQRVIIARALAQDTKILLLDEPTAFLDLQHQVEMCALLRRLKRDSSMTIVLVSHDLNIASQSCDRVAVMKDGAIQALGSPEHVMRADVLRQVYSCDVLIDRHPESGLPRITLPGDRSAQSSS
ncbi:Hemin import ATP-binding protein HmuV [Nitrospira sp. KM1]|uniref:ABC transporter ATP-binding protein n=1 Tax=Nitrospira sp. KM1 TaxID=1936990 RepID=UPI0013A7667C|nr:ABC transporter ATP-binding protein [Nitrospira sp. KM1]BCA53650.1 Hemin import ATP-binding protein HmuV [Nitrospira sp. KM1]